MLSHRLSFPRRSSNRPLRPPNTTKQKPRPRLFTQNSPLFLISPQSPRPQLPFLYTPSAARPLQPRARQYQLSRLLTPERKRYLKHEFILAGKFIIYGSSLIFLGNVIYFGVQSESLERKHPTPPDWSLWSRIQLRIACGHEDPSSTVSGFIDYAQTGDWYTTLLARLENPRVDGAGLEPILKDDGDIYVAGVGKSGLNISSKSETWRRGYHACLMGAARSAEHLDGWVKDTTSNLAFPSNVVIGPSNPRPKPVPYGAADPPLEENCEKAFDSPESFYTKILTTQGFSTRQRLDAALAYADWLDFKGLPESAEEMFDWGLDIAMGGLPIEAHNAVEIKSGVISSDANYISSNLLLATTSLAIHHARNKNFAAAFPIFVSVLRATRQLPHPPQKTPQNPFEQNSVDNGGFISGIKSFLNGTPYPPAPPSGDEPQLRTPLVVCEEAGIMAHIGEIVFASASSATNPAPTSSPTAGKIASQNSLHAGISWTRDAVDIAESTFIGTARQDREALKKCAECLSVGVGNWEKMVDRMISNAAPRETKQNQPGGVDSSPSADTAARGNDGAGWKDWAPISWLGSFHIGNNEGGGGEKEDADADSEAYERWQREAGGVMEKRMKLRRMLRMEGLSDVEGESIGRGPGDWGPGWGLLFR